MMDLDIRVLWDLLLRNLRVIILFVAVVAILFAGVTVKEGALIDSSILMPGAVVEPGAEVHYSIVAENVVVKSGAVIGKKPEECADVTEWGVAVVAEGLTVGANSVVGPKAMVREDVKEGETV